MRKILIPILFIVFTLTFSGKSFKGSNLSDNCGPIFHISNFFPCNQMVIEDLAAGITTTINNPTFPFEQNFQGPQFRLTLHFNGSHTGQIFLTGDNGDCYATTHYNQNAWQITFSATCSWYLFEFIGETGWSCPN